MSRFSKVPGAGVKAIKNPVYWSRMQIQNQRYKAQSQALVERFNERWHRLGDIQNKIANDFVDEIIEDLRGKELDKLMLYIDEMQSWVEFIEGNIDTVNNSHLSKYATRIKNVGIFSMKMCKKYEKYSDISTVEYNAKEKMIYMDNESFYYFGWTLVVYPIGFL